MDFFGKFFTNSGIFRPIVLWVAPPEVTADKFVRAAPEVAYILRGLHRTTRRTEHDHCQSQFAIEQRRLLAHPEKVL